MSAKIALRPDFSAFQLRKLAQRCRDSRQTRRLLALAAVYDGMSRAEASKVGGMDRQTRRDWVHRFNEDGPGGLTNRLGGKAKATPERGADGGVGRDRRDGRRSTH